MMRVVLDTNTIISGLFQTGTPYQVYQAAFNDLYVLITSEELLRELETVIRRKKFAPALVAKGKAADEIISDHRDIAEVVISKCNKTTCIILEYFPHPAQGVLEIIIGCCFPRLQRPIADHQWCIGRHVSRF